MRSKTTQTGKLWLTVAVVIAIISYLIYNHQKEATAKKAQQALEAAQIEELKKLAVRWDDALKVASAASRITLHGPVQELQKIRRETSDATVPSCLMLAKSNLVDGMDGFINGILAFMQDDGATSRTSIQKGKQDMDLFAVNVKNCSAQP